MRTHRTLVIFTAAVSIAVLVASAPPVRAAETPRRGGVLLAAIAADAPSLDPHQEETFATLELVAPCYSPVSENGRLCYGDGAHGQGGRRRMLLMSPSLPTR